MNCGRCGFKLTGESQFCQSCGAPVNNNQMGQLNSGQYNQQINYSNGYGSQKINRNSNSRLFILTGVIGVALIAILFIAMKLFGNSSTYSVNFENFSLEIPADLVYKEEYDAFAISNKSESWVIDFTLENGDFSSVKNRMSELPTSMKRRGFECSEAVTRTIKGVEFITMEASLNSQSGIVGFAKVNSMYYVAITLLTDDNSYNYKLLENAALIISKMKYNNASNGISVPSFDISDIITE